MNIKTHLTRKRWRALSVAGVLLASALTVGVLFAANEQHQPNASVSPVPAPERGTAQQGETHEQINLPPMTKVPPKYRKLDSNLNRLADDPAAIRESSTTGSDAIDQVPNSVLVTFYVEPAQVANVRQYLEESGVFVRNVGEDYIEAHVPPVLLPAASAQPGVLRVDTVIPPQPNQVRERVISQGVNLHGADAWHRAGYRGNNVRVGIIDTGFDGFRQQQGDELPRNVVARCYFDGPQTPSSNVVDCETDGKAHGTIVAETLIDVAPDANLYIANPYSLGDLRDAVDWMVAQRVKIINVSLGYSPDGPGDGTSPSSNSALRTIDAAVAGGITWVNSSGNDALKVWYGTFSDTNQNDVHNFTPQDEGNHFILPTNSRIVAHMRWDDSWEQATCDLDLGLVRYNDSNNKWVLVAADDQIQGAEQGRFPLAQLVMDQAPAGEYQFFIEKHRCPNNPAWIQLISWIDDDLQYYSAGHHMGNPAEGRNPGMLAVGATHYWNTSAIAPYSSRGPTLDDRIKPDITGIACARSTAFTPGNLYGNLCWFPGTSQSAPHVAGLAALAQQRFPNYQPTAITQYLRQNTSDRGTVGADNAWGHGLAMLPNPSVEPPPLRAGPASNIVVVNGHNAGEAVFSWDAATGATYYRIGCVNMNRDYRRAKATTTGNWREAFQYVDVESVNLDATQPTYTLYGLQEGAEHACAVLSNNARYGQPTWPSSRPYWQKLTITNRGGACPVCSITP